ncbi:MAG: 50S ribosomal protein L31e [Promethearchaeati archaeon SRVP18_Atabeyarchaeia-1]
MSSEKGKRAEKAELAKEEAKPKSMVPGETESKPVAPEHMEERLYTVPLGKTRYAPYYKRSTRAIRLIRIFFTRHMKAERVIITKDLNEAIWANGIRNPPRRVKVRATKDDEGNVTVYPVE